MGPHRWRHGNRKKHHMVASGFGGFVTVVYYKAICVRGGWCYELYGWYHLPAHSFVPNFCVHRYLANVFLGCKWCNYVCIECITPFRYFIAIFHCCKSPLAHWSWDNGHYFENIFKFIYEIKISVHLCKWSYVCTRACKPISSAHKGPKWTIFQSYFQYV